MKLIYKSTGKPVAVNDIAHTFRGEPVVVHDFRPPHKASSTGRVYLKFIDENTDMPRVAGSAREFYPSVIDAMWVES